MKAGCCFCNKQIEGREIYNIKLINWENKKEPLGDYFCHLECFKKKMHQEIKKATKSTLDKSTKFCS